jgi:uncharacterized protein (UPF0261 family)
MSLHPKSILIFGCFDTKSEVFAYLRQSILEKGETVITINTGIQPIESVFPIDFDADTVAKAGGSEIEMIRQNKDRGQAIDVMGKGAARIAAQLVAQGKVKGAMGMGGGGGTYIALAAMQAIPLGIPKICLSTVASKDLSRQIGDKDIMLIPSVVDVAGLNGIIQILIQQAATAICGMSNVQPIQNRHSKGSIAISMFGNTTACVDRCTALLKALNYEVLAFHATGVGGKTMESLIREGYFKAVLDVTTTELADDLCEGICNAGPTRLTAAAEMGIPQIVVPGCLDMVNFAHLDTVPVQFKNRHLYSWAPDVTLMRTDVSENIELGKRLAQKVNLSTAPASIFLPLKGISQVDSEGNIFYNPQANHALFNSIKEHAQRHISIQEHDVHINDPAFADALVQTLLEILHL